MGHLGLLVSVAALGFGVVHGPELRFPGTATVTCGPWEPGVATQTIHVELPGPRRGWEMRAVLADVEDGRRIRIPADVVSAEPRGALIFVHRARPLVEASSSEEEGRGWMSFSAASCTPGAPVSFAIHARLGSELSGGNEVRVDGAFWGNVEVAGAAG
jgi:hypothetical protein